jgi:predicted ATPase/GAF domain-containing protein
MPSAPTFACDQLIEVWRDGPATLFRGRHVRSERDALVKAVVRDAAGDGEWVRREAGILDRLRGPGILECLDASPGQPTYLVVACEREVVPLREIIARGRLSLPDALDVVAAVATVLVRVHAGGVIHRDLRPETIGWHPGWRTASLLDVGRAAEPGPPRADEPAPASFAYISPEQTGRINRPVDPRSDLYALGALAYQLVSGEVPFTSRDPMELVHAHVARTPAAPADRVPELPPVISRIILRLLEKNAEDRYQSATGLLADIARCRAGLLNGRVADFELGTADRPVQLRIPDRLYGRAREVGALEEALRRTSHGAPATLFLVGPSGIGKSALVRHLRAQVSRSGGLHLDGKFDQLQRDVPYSALRQALRGLARNLLSRSDEEVARWRERIAVATGGNGQLISDLVPELASVLGPQPPLEHLTPADAEVQVYRVMAAFLGVFAGAGPLVLFLDDLQWIDGATLGLVTALAADPGRRFLLLGSYRDADVGPEHPLAVALRGLEKHGTQSLQVGPLPAATVAEILCDTLRAAPDQVGPLAELVHHRTGGNPFFIAQLLDTLYERGLLTRSTARGGWSWELDAIRSAGITDDIVELMIQKLRRLSPAAQKAIRTGACIGNAFSVTLLATVAQRDCADVRADLDPSIEAGFVTRDGDEIRFVHDRVQQAAYALIPEAERDTFHLEVGRLLLHGVGDVERSEHLFPVVLHLNRARRLIASTAERRRLLELNVIAAERARSAVAFERFLDLIQVAAELLPDDAWDGDRELARRVHLDLADACYVNRRYDRAAQYARAALERAPSRIEAIRATTTLVLCAMAEGQPTEAARIGLELLGEVGLRVSRDPSKLDVVRALVGVRLRLARYSPDRLAQLPETNDPEVIAVAEFCMLLLAPLFYCSPNVFPIVGLRMLSHALRCGYTSISPATFMMLAIILAQLGQHGQARRFAELSWCVQRRFGARKVEVYLHAGENLFLRWSRAPYRELLNVVENRALPLAVDVGNSEFVAHQLLIAVELRFLAGEPLSDLKARCDLAQRSIEQTEQWVPLDGLRALRQVVANLSDGGQPPSELRGAFFDPEEVLPRMARDGNVTGVFAAAAYGGFTALLFGDPARALSATRAAEHLIPRLAVWYVHTIFYFVQSIALLQGEGPPRRRRVLRANRRRLRAWSRACPANFSHLWLLVEAEHASRRGRPGRAADLYERAVEAAGEHGILHGAAFARELYAGHLVRAGCPGTARDHLLLAYRAYRAWGASAKLRDLEARHPELFVGEAWAAQPSAAAAGSQLDLASAWKASRVLAGEIVLERLLRRLLEVIVENAGAVSGELILDRQDQGWRVEAAVRAAPAGGEMPDIRVLQGLPLAQANLPLSVVNYVIHSGESVLLDDAGADASIQGDPYFLAAAPRSVLALPIMTQGRVVGVLYLENPVTRGAFTADRVEFLTLLAGQAAISLENALLYESLERKVEERTEKLRKLQEIAVTSAHHAGMAEIATDVLHNVGNVLTSIKTSCDSLDRALLDSKIGALDKLAALLGGQGDQLDDFLNADPRGKVVPAYLLELARALREERGEAREEVAQLTAHVHVIEEVIAAQQAYARGQLLNEEMDLGQAVDDVLSLCSPGLRTSAIQIVRDYRPVAPVLVQRTKLAHMLVHLIRNAEEAMAGTSAEDRVLRIEVGTTAAGEPFIRIADRGEGISQENLVRIFGHGFTTRPSKRGFGLHFCANSMTEMGGRIAGESAGPDRGAALTLFFAARPADFP